jgi:putative YphP/YqiW family bacilliredoxin
MKYDPRRVQPFRDELTSLGVKELMSAEEVDKTLSENKGTLLVVINSVCGCAAGAARPAVKKALSKEVKPDNAVSVFAGQEEDATARLRDKWLTGIPPSSPAIALFRDQELVHYIPRYNIERKEADTVAEELSAAFDRFCVKV